MMLGPIETGAHVISTKEGPKGVKRRAMMKTRDGVKRGQEEVAQMNLNGRAEGGVTHVLLVKSWNEREQTSIK